VETLEPASPALACFVPFSVLTDASSKGYAVKVGAEAARPLPSHSYTFCLIVLLTSGGYSRSCKRTSENSSSRHFGE
jgi:hypothetical protein